MSMEPASLTASKLPARTAATSAMASAGMMAGSTHDDIMASSMPQSTIWVTATRATPMILPSMSWAGLTDDTTTSSTLLPFSSMMDVITIWPYINRNI